MRDAGCRSLFWAGATVALLLVACALDQARPQNSQKPDISVETKTVNVLAAVHDKDGKVIANLTKDDFTLLEDGQPQTIQYFSQNSDLPLTLGLLVDTSMSQRRVLPDERTASYSFLDHLMRQDKDKAFVLHFDREVELLQDITSVRSKLQAALQLLDTTREDDSSTSTPSDQRGQRGGGRGGMHGGAGTLLYDAVYLASDEVVKKQPGRKALIVLSDGVDHGSKESLVSAIESAQRANALVYSILFADNEDRDRGGNFGGWHGGGMGGPMGGGGGHRRFPQQENREDGKKILEQISQQTGARLFEVSKKMPIDKIYAQIEEELRNQYDIAYTPSNPTPGYHKIQLSAKPKNMVVEARDGYYVDH